MAIKKTSGTKTKIRSKKTRDRQIRQSWDNRLFSLAVMTVVLILTAMCIIPFIYLLAVSLSGIGPVQRGEVFLLPRQFTLSVYETIVKNGTLLKSMQRTIFLTAAYVLIAMTMTILCAYPLSEPGLRGKKYIFPFIMFTMYFSGGMIPGYLLINGLGLIDSYWALILPGAISTYNMIVMRSFFAAVPTALREAALIDGAGDVTILLRVILPLSKPVIATLTLFYAVSRWNGMQDALLYINDPAKTVLQIRLKQMIQNTNAVNELMAEGAAVDSVMALQTVRAGALMFSLIPVMLVYPFLQKYFVKGTTIGSVKG